MSQPRSGVGKNVAPDPGAEGLGWVRGHGRGWVHRPEPARLTTRLFLRRSLSPLCALQPGQLGEVRRNPPRLIFAELACGAPVLTIG